MNRSRPKQRRILAISPSTRGFGFAVLEIQDRLVDWGVKSVAEDRNAQCLVKVEELIGHYEPDVLVFEDHSAKGSRRSPRIRALGREIVVLAAKCKIKVAVLSRKKVRRVFFAEGNGTKYALAEMLAQRFPQELGFRMPPKRRLWMSEDYRMDIFDAIALAIAFERTRNYRDTVIT